MFTELDIFRLSTMVPGILSGSKISGAIRFERGAGLKSEVVAIAGILWMVAMSAPISYTVCRRSVSVWVGVIEIR
jgi:hypothetical protein